MYNKPSYKFKKDDVFISYLQANPKYKIYFYLNDAKINNGLDMGKLHETDTLSVFSNNQTGSTLKPFLEKDSNKPLHFFNDSKAKSTWENLSEGEQYIGSYLDVTSSLTKEYIIKNAGTASLITGVTTQSTIDKLGSLKNVYNYYRYLSPYFDFDEYIAENDGLAKSDDDHPTPVPNYLNFIEIPRLYKGNKVKEGSLVLSFYYTGSLVAEARDTNRNGIIYETTGSNTGNVIGTVLYPEGLILITASYSLNTAIKDGYLSPLVTASKDSSWIDQPRWAHFMSHRAYITATASAADLTYAPASSSYTIEFEGETVVPTHTMLCHADKNDLVWSNNPTFVEKKSEFSGNSYEEIFVVASGSKQYKESEQISIKNIVSSSYNNYSASFDPTTYISKIGVYDEDGDLIAVANLATPVKKTTKQDYTFKLKLDL
tara:strand:- start:1482 stop:2771 length:1290 start_codon:yes stop_codon:yes gene_type:complete